MHIAVFPGSFCPPTYGHLDIVKRAATIFDKLIIVCSRAKDKVYDFSEDECVQLWGTYKLPDNVEVKTFLEFTRPPISEVDIIMIRGLRDTKDFEFEHEVMQLNYQVHGIRDFTYLVSAPSLKVVSSSAAREAARQLDLIRLGSMVSPQVATKLLEKALEVENLYLVVGRPGAGKSTFLKACEAIDSRNVWINTDNYSKIFSDVIRQHFSGQDIVKVAIEKPQELSALIGQQWLEILSGDLKKACGSHNVFVEIAYALAEDKRIYRYVGGKILFVGCDEKTHRTRIINRGTPELMPFFNIIPGLNESIEIARKEKLTITIVETNYSSPCECAKEFLLKTSGGE